MPCRRHFYGNFKHVWSFLAPFHVFETHMHVQSNQMVVLKHFQSFWAILDSNIFLPKAKFLDEIQTKVLKVFLLVIQSHLYSFALRFLFLHTHATSYSFFSALYRRKEENLIGNHFSFKKSIQKPQVWELSRLCPGTWKKLYVHAIGFYSAILSIEGTVWNFVRSVSNICTFRLHSQYCFVLSWTHIGTSFIHMGCLQR